MRYFKNCAIPGIASLTLHLGILSFIQFNHLPLAQISIRTIQPPRLLSVNLQSNLPLRLQTQDKPDIPQSTRPFSRKILTNIRLLSKPEFCSSSRLTVDEKRSVLNLRQAENDEIEQKTQVRNNFIQSTSQVNTNISALIIIAPPLYYPQDALKRRVQGRVTLQAQVNGWGKLYAVQILHSSGDRILDYAALNWFKQLKIRNPKTHQSPRDRRLIQNILFRLD